MNIDTREITLEPADNARLLALCGPFDDNIKQLERRLGIEINRRDNHFKLTGRAICVHAAADILRSLYVDTAPMRGQIQDIEPEQIHLAIKEARVLEQSAESVPEYGKAVNIKTKRGVIKPRTPNQAQYIANILDHDITFGVGPAGTGKTYLAVAAAVDALERQEIRRILLTRPAVEAGEKLGFLPGDLSQKVDPYLRPLYDALFEMLGFEKVEKLIERNVIEVAPLAYMRGRTLNDAFIILDESQNTTIEQMKMFLTRIGFNSKAVITGDITQIDLPRSTKSGLRHAIEVKFHGVFNSDGTLNRKKLGELVFENKERMAQLNEVIYRFIVPEVQRRCQAGELVAVDAINLIESGAEALCDRTVAVTAPAELRVRRIMARDGIDERYARMRISAQKSDEFYRGKCDYELSNTAETPEDFREIARDFFRRLIGELREEKNEASR